MSYFFCIGETLVFALPSHQHPGALDHLADDGPHHAPLLQRADQRGGPGVGHRYEQSSARLRVVEREKVVLINAIRRYTSLQVLPVVLEAAWVDAIVRQRHGPLPDRNAASVYVRPHTARLQHLRQVAEETVARYVCGCGDADLAYGVAGSLIQEGGHLYGIFYLFLGDDLPLERRSQDTETERFGQNQR